MRHQFLGGTLYGSVSSFLLPRSSGLRHMDHARTPYTRQPLYYTTLINLTLGQRSVS